MRTEKGKAFELKSDTPIECFIYDVDNCLLTGETLKRCDWLFTVPKDHQKNINSDIQKKHAYYIELKGGDHRTACEQLYNAIDRTKTSFLNYEFHARIVSPKRFQPELNNNEFYKKVKRLIRKKIEVRKVHSGNQFKYTENI